MSRSKIRPAFARHALGLIVIAAGLARAGHAADWQGLTNNSPFGQAPATMAASAPDELEFRGVVQEEELYLVNLYNPANKTSQWIPVHGRVPGLEVRSYDASADKIEVTQGGRALTLPLKRARVALVQAPVPVPAGPAPVVEGGNGPQVVEPGRGRPAGGESPAIRNLPPEAQAMIQEFRRRRAERANQQQQNSPRGRQAPPPQQRR